MHLHIITIITQSIEKNPNWILGKWIISIFSFGSYSPISDRFNVLKLNFDDISERDIDTNIHNEIFFNENLAKEIHEFINNISNNDTVGNEEYIPSDKFVDNNGTSDIPPVIEIPEKDQHAGKTAGGNRSGDLLYRRRDAADRRINFAGAQRSKHLKTIHLRHHKVKQYTVIITGHRPIKS